MIANVGLTVFGTHAQNPDNARTCTKEGSTKQIMLSRHEHVDGNGLHGLAGFIELDHKIPDATA